MPTHRSSRMPRVDLDQVNIRDATLRDFEDVIHLVDELYDGMDYLPTLYTALLQHPLSNCFVAQLDSKVIGFCNLKVLPADGVMVSVASRIHMDYQGAGVMSKLLTTSMSRTQRRHPGVNIHTWSTLSNVFYEKLLRNPDGKMRFVRIWRAVQIRADYADFCQSVSECSPSPGNQNVTRVEVDRALSILTDPTTMESLFPDPYIEGFPNWFTMKTSRSAIEQIVKSHQVFCTLDSATGTCTAVSFGVAFKLGVDIGYNIFYHPSATDGRTVDDLTVHTERHIRHLHSLIVGKAMVKVNVNLNLPPVYDSEGIGRLRRCVGKQAEVVSDDKELIIEEDLPNNMASKL